MLFVIATRGLSFLFNLAGFPFKTTRYTHHKSRDGDESRKQHSTTTLRRSLFFTAFGVWQWESPFELVRNLTSVSNKKTITISGANTRKVFLLT